MSLTNRGFIGGSISPAIAVSIHTITTTNSPIKNFLSLNGSPKNL
jgi:hypothetical protein